MTHSVNNENRIYWQVDSAVSPFPALSDNPNSENRSGRKPLCVDLFCGLGGWSEGFLAEGYDCIGFDIERHDYGTGGYPGQLVIQDVLTLHGSQFKDAAVIVASPPCQKYSYMAMPWTRAKNMAAEYRSGVRSIDELNALFLACFRIAGEAGVPLIVENVRGAQPWVGPAKWNYGSFYLWGDVPALMPFTNQLKGRHNFHFQEKTGLPSPSFHGAEYEPSLQRAAAIKNNGGSWFNVAHNTTSGKGQNPDGRAIKTLGHVNLRDGHAHTRHLTNQRESYAVKVPGIKLSEVGFNVAVARQINPDDKPTDFVRTDEMKRQHLGFSRKAASAHIAKIPFALARHIARCYKPQLLDALEVAVSS